MSEEKLHSTNTTDIESLNSSRSSSSIDSTHGLNGFIPQYMVANNLSTKISRKDSELELGRRNSLHSLYPDQLIVDNLERSTSRKSFSATNNNASQDSLDSEKYDPNEVYIEPGDKWDMYKLPSWRKGLIVATLSLIGLDICLLSSCWSLSTDIITQYNVSHEVFILGISLYIFGMACGPLFLSPISELFYGRRSTYIFGFILCMCFQAITAFSKNYGAMLFGRYMTGLFGSVFLSVAPGTISDIFPKETIGVPLSIYSLTPFLGPTLAPALAGGITISQIDSMWTFYILLIFTGFLFALLLIAVPETYKPVLLKLKAQQLRKETGNKDLYAPIERTSQNLFVCIITAPKRPLSVLFLDPMMAILCFYSGVILGIVYLFFVSIPYTFKTVYGFNVFQQGLAFLGMAIGMFLSSVCSHFFSKLYLKLCEKNGKPEPEYRFPSLMAGGILAPFSLIFLAFTTYKQCHWIIPIIASAIYGFSTGLIITSIFTYTVDAYKKYAASGAAANTFTRCTMAAIFPLFGLQMYEGLGVHYATLLLACVAFLLTPVPFIFYKFGKTLREKSPYAWDDDS